MTSADEQPKPADRQQSTAPDDDPEGLFAYAGWAVLGLVLLGAIVAGLLQGAGLVILVLAAGAMIAAIMTFWSSIQSLSGETVFSTEEAISMAAPMAEEEQKRAVIRTLKDIELDHSAGKISDEDYAALNEKFRAEAKRLLRILDERNLSERRAAEALVEQQLIADGLAEPDSEPEREQQPKKKGKKKKDKKRRQRAEAAEPVRDCERCGTVNDPDAAFCKRCGQGLPPVEERA